MGGSLGDLNSANRYVYADDDPVNLVDPSGKLACWLAIPLAFLLTIGILPLIFLSLPLDLVAFLLLGLSYVSGGIYAVDAMMSCT